MTRVEFSSRIKAQAHARAKGKCETCDAHLYVGKFHYDHIIPDAIGGAATIENCRVICVACHSHKTAREDIPRIAKTKRQHAAHIGAKQRGRGWPKPEPQENRASAPIRKWAAWRQDAGNG